MIRQFTAIVERDGHSYIAYCPGLSLKVIGTSIVEARERLAEAVEVFINTASPEEIRRRQEVYITQIELVEEDRTAHAEDVSREPAFLAAARHATTRLYSDVIPPARRRVMT